MTLAQTDPPRRFLLTAFNHGTAYRAEHLFAPEAAGTRTTLVFEGQPATLLARLFGLWAGCFWVPSSVSLSSISISSARPSDAIASGRLDMENRALVKGVDRTLGALARATFRNFIAQPLFALNYKVTILGSRRGSELHRRLIVVANHVSSLDGPFLMNNAWPHARIRATAWHAEYTDWKQWWLMKLFGVSASAVPRTLPGAGTAASLTGKSCGPRSAGAVRIKLRRS